MRKLNWVIAEVRRLKNDEVDEVRPDVYALHHEAFDILVNEGLEMLELMQKIGELDHQMVVTEQAMLSETQPGNNYWGMRATLVKLGGEQRLLKQQIDEWCSELATPDNDG